MAQAVRLLPDGPARDRAAATARTVATIFGPFDLDRVGTALAPAVELVDHRSAGFGSVDGAEQLVRTLATVFEVAGDVMERCEDVIAVQPNALLVSLTWSGKERVGGGEFELPHLQLYILGADGLVTHAETFAADQRREALARYDELTIAPTAPRIENAATRALERGLEAWEARDWERFAALFAAGFRGVDRRTMVHLELDRGQWLDSYRPIVEMTSSRPTKEVLATRGDRLALVRVRWEGTDGSIGPSEIEWLLLIEVDGRGDHVAVVTFDPDDLEAPYAELDARYAAGEAAAYGHAAMTRTFLRSFAARDWSTLATVLAPDLVVNDHRILGWETLRGPQAYVQALRSLVDLAPDARLRLDHVVEMSHHAVLYAPTWIGTHEGGAFEAPSVIVAELDGRGRIRRFDQYDLDQLDDARVRFDAVGTDTSRASLENVDAAFTRFAEPGSDPLRIPPNAATRASDRLQECSAAGDWDALRALYAPTLVWDDRRRLNRVTGDLDMAIANARFMVGLRGTRLSRTLLATAGDRLALEHLRFAGSYGEDATFEVETLRIIEVDTEGRIVVTIGFDPDDRRAASAELSERYSRSDAGRWAPARWLEVTRGVREHDLARVRAAIPDDFFFDDHRRVGPGRIESADALIAWLAALFELSPDAAIEPMYYIAAKKHGQIAIAHTFGTRVDGGAFESVFVQLVLWEGDRPVGAELFELEDLAVARARFEALRTALP